MTPLISGLAGGPRLPAGPDVRRALYEALAQVAPVGGSIKWQAA